MHQMKFDAYSFSANINITLLLLNLGGHLETASQSAEITGKLIYDSFLLSLCRFRAEEKHCTLLLMFQPAGSDNHCSFTTQYGMLK